jgi:hypothetical protein
MACGNLYNVKSFGAVGNGVANDQAAIQAAIDAASAAGGGVVCLPAGQYRVDSMLVPKARVSFHGEARATSIVQPHGAIWAFRASPAAHTDFECEFADLTIQGDGNVNGVNGSGTNLGAINLERCDHVTFRNVRVERFSASGGFGIAIGECYFSVFDRCYFNFIQNVACELQIQQNGCNQTVIRDCEFHGNNMPSSIGLRIGNTQSVLVTGCDFEGSLNGAVAVDLHDSDGITLIGNYIELWQVAAIRGSVGGGSHRVIVEGNVINSVPPAVDLNNTSGVLNERWVIHHNRFADLASGSLAIRIGNALGCVTYGNDTSSDLPPQPHMLDTVPNVQGDNREFVGYTGTIAWDPASLADGAVTFKTVPVPGARIGDPALASFTSLTTQNMLLTASVQADDTVRCVLMNKQTTAVNLGNGTLRAIVIKQLV